jgi:NAD(P)-dependent dehydrogenase (short-subunit alcohol dehydrogenase family)
MRELRGKVAVVTGAASGIGRALALALAHEGATLALSDIDATGLAETQRLLPAGATASTDRVDVADRAAMHAWADRVVATHGAAHLVINNAGVAVAATIRELRYEDLDWLMGINFWGVVHGTKAFLPHLERAGEGHIVNISSVFGLIGVPGQGAYNAAKFAVRGFTECLRQELELTNSPVSATCVHPGGIRTNIARNSRLGPESAQQTSREDLTKRFEQVARTTPEQAARAILAGVRRNARRVLIGADAFVIDRLQRSLPTAYQRVVVAGARRTGLVP